MMLSKSLSFSQRLAILVSAYLSYGFVITAGDARGIVVNTWLNENAVMTFILLITLLMIEPARQLMQRCSLRDYTIRCSVYLSALRGEKLPFRKPEELFSTTMNYSIFHILLILNTPARAKALQKKRFYLFQLLMGQLA